MKICLIKHTLSSFHRLFEGSYQILVSKIKAAARQYDENPKTELCAFLASKVGTCLSKAEINAKGGGGGGVISQKGIKN